MSSCHLMCLSNESVYNQWHNSETSCCCDVRSSVRLGPWELGFPELSQLFLDWNPGARLRLKFPYKSDPCCDTPRYPICFYLVLSGSWFQKTLFNNVCRDCIFLILLVGWKHQKFWGYLWSWALISTKAWNMSSCPSPSTLDFFGVCRVPDPL